MLNVASLTCKLCVWKAINALCRVGTALFLRRQNFRLFCVHFFMIRGHDKTYSVLFPSFSCFKQQGQPFVRISSPCPICCSCVRSSPVAWMPVKEFEPRPSADATWPSGLPADRRLLTALSRSAPGSAGGVTEGWTPFLALTMKKGRNVLICACCDFQNSVSRINTWTKILNVQQKLHSLEDAAWILTYI